MPLGVDESQLLALEIADLRIVKLANGISRLHLRVDDVQLDFNYRAEILGRRVGEGCFGVAQFRNFQVLRITQL